LAGSQLAELKVLALAVAENHNELAVICELGLLPCGLRIAWQARKR